MAVSSTSANNNSTSGPSGNSSSSASFDSWYSDAKSHVMDLNASDDDLIKFLGSQFQAAAKGGADSEAKRNALQQLVELRSQATSAMTNMLKTLAQTAQLVIANIRP